MIDSLTESVMATGDDAAGCCNELGALIDIAIYKQAPRMASLAEHNLLELFSSPSVSSAIRQNMMEQLAETQLVIADRTSQNAEAFAMPASLLHLVAQFARDQMANEVAHPVVHPSQLDEIRSKLHEASFLQDARGFDIVDPRRFSDAEEVCASFSKIPCGHEQLIDFSENNSHEDRSRQMDGLLAAVEARGFVGAPLLIDKHFMLLIAEKEDTGGCKFTVANTFPDYDAIALNALKKVMSEPRTVNVLSRDLQIHIGNSCGVLATLLSNEIDACRENDDFETQDYIQNKMNFWSSLNAQQQQDIVMAQRSLMMGNAVENRIGNENRSRFVEQ